MTRMTLLLAATALAGLAPAAGHARADGPASAPARVYEYPADRAGKGLAVWAASSRAGLIFTDGEAPDVRAAVSGAAGTTTVEYGATEHDGPWRAKGTLTFDEGVGQRPLPLKLPGRGLYRLSLTARSGEATAKAETPLAVLPEPDPPARASPWGIFYIRPLSPAAAEKTPLRASAAGIRRLGASWVRLNFWHFSYGKVTVADGRATAACGYYRRIVREMRRQGLFIMGEFALVPRELSSRPNEAKRRGDSGPLFARVPPKDYRLWEAMVEQMARDFAGDIDVWEVGNEPDLRGKYWAGTPEEYVEHVRHTARAVKRGHPKARIAVGGFTGINDFSRKVLTACGDSIDIVSFHYTDAGGRARQWRSALRALELDRSMWNTEERSEVPLRDLACGVERVFKFIQAHDRYGGYRPLMRADLTPRPSAVLYAVGAKCIGDGRFDGGATRNG